MGLGQIMMLKFISMKLQIKQHDVLYILMIQVYNLFRQLGLRHLLVVPRASRVIGMITRKDLLIEVLQYVQGFLYCLL